MARTNREDGAGINPPNDGEDFSAAPVSREGDPAPVAVADVVVEVDPPATALEQANVEVSLDDVLAVFHMAKMGLHVGKWKPSPRMAGAYSRVRELLKQAGKLPR